RRREVRNQTVVEAYVVREPVHQNDRRIRPRVVTDVDPVLVPPHESLLVSHRCLGKDGHQRKRREKGQRRFHSTRNLTYPSFSQTIRRPAAAALPEASGWQ